MRKLERLHQGAKKLNITATDPMLVQIDEPDQEINVRQKAFSRAAEKTPEEYERKLRLSCSRLVNIMEKERKGIAKRLYDGVLQQMAYIKMRLGSKLRETEEGDTPLDGEFLEESIALVKCSMDDIRAVIEELWPSMLDDFGLVLTARDYCREFRRSNLVANLDVEMDLEEEDAPKSLQIQIFRVLQEALSNLALHNQAKDLKVVLKKEEERICLRVSDAGRDIQRKAFFPPQKCAVGPGLTGMRERTELSGGTFSFQFGTRGETTIEATWPLGTLKEA